MSILIAIPNRDISKFATALKDALPNEVVEVWPEVENYHNVEVIVAWNTPSEVYQQSVNCKWIASFGAGVDSIISEQLADDIQITRVVDDHLASDMARYVLTHVLAHQQHLQRYFTQSITCKWKPKRALASNKVTLLGAGQLGQACAKTLSLNNFDVTTWSRQSVSCAHSQKHFTGTNQLAAAVKEADYLVCLLPLTEHTLGILNASLFALLKPTATLINVGRGKHLVEQDLIDALDAEQLASAVLDVFTIEPLPNNHPFWHHPKILVTPHASALTSVNVITQQIVDNVIKYRENKTLDYLVNRKQGY